MTCCPSCGYNLTADEIVRDGDWEIDPRGIAFFRGKLVRGLTAACVIILHSIAGASGRPISAEVLLNRASGSDDLNIVAVQIFRIRKCLERAEIPVPFRTIWGRGYAWGAA